MWRSNKGTGILALLLASGIALSAQVEPGESRPSTMLEMLAERGSRDAQLMLGSAYSYGDGIGG